MITEDSLIKPVEFLTDSLCEGRGTGTRGGFETAAWLIRQFKDAGLVPFNMFGKSFRYEGRTGHNIVGLCPSSIPSDKYVIIAAHYDNIGVLSGTYYPGADSNASGVSVLVNLAKVFRKLRDSGYTVGQNILFVALDGKQLSMSGSQAFFDCLAGGAFFDPVNRRMIRMEKVSVMVNLDIVGGTLEPLNAGRKDYLIMLSDNASLQAAMSEVNASHRPSMDIAFDYYGSKDFTDLFFRRVSDQKPFVERGIPSVMFTSGITMNTNKVEDNAGSIDAPVLRERAMLIYRWLDNVMRLK